MSNSTAIRPAHFDARILAKIGFAIILFLALVFGVFVAAIYAQMGNIRSELASVKTGRSTLDRLGRVEKAVDEMHANLATIQGQLGTIDNAVEQMRTNRSRTTDEHPRDLPRNVLAGFYVTEQEAAFIREFLKVPPKKTGPPAKMTLWTRVPPQATKPLPDELVSKAEKLKGLRYAVDANSAIALIEPSTSIVIALI